MKDKIWLRRKPSKGKWTCGLARLENGMIVVAEIFSQDYGVVGSRPIDFEKPDGAMGPIRLYSGERGLIIKDLYVACCEHIGIEPEWSALKEDKK